MGGSAVIGVGRTRFGEHYETDPEMMIEEAWLKASKEAGVERKDLDAFFVSDYFLPITNKIGLEEGFLSELSELHIPMEIVRSFSSAFHNACNAVLSGRYNLVLVGGLEKMTDRWDKIRDDLMLLEDPWSYYAGCTPEANHELMLREYIKKYGIRGEDADRLDVALAQIAVKNHKHALKNEYAQYRREISVEQVLMERKKACSPLGIYDFAPVSDGATALVLTNRKIAGEYSSAPVSVYGSASATDFITFPSRENRTGFTASCLAMEGALKTTHVQLEDISILELYDQSTFMEMVALEDLGFSERGKAWMHIYRSCEEYNGYYEVGDQRLYVNLNGGLKADGNPLGATGGAQIHEVFKQLRGELGERQVKIDGDNPRYGCTLEHEGFGTKAYVNIFGR